MAKQRTINLSDEADILLCELLKLSPFKVPVSQVIEEAIKQLHSTLTKKEQTNHE